ncbi:hypothetical protein DAH69_09020 [Sphingomonas koreensis]|nr:hypothetical protein DAH69_09020 [Sphingomonas koreensis]
MYRTRSAASAIVLALLVAGCGGGGGDTSALRWRQRDSRSTHAFAIDGHAVAEPFDTGALAFLSAADDMGRRRRLL